MKLPLNMSAADRVIRAIISLGLLALSLTGVITGGVSILAEVIAAIFLVTVVTGFCPIYALFHLSTKPVK